MSASKILTAALAVVAVLLAITMSFTTATNLEMAGFWLLAAATSGFAILVQAEESRPQYVRCR